MVIDLELIVCEDYANTCPYDGAITELVENHVEYSTESCPVCHRNFNFWTDGD